MTRLSYFLGLAALAAATSLRAGELPAEIKQAGALKLTVNSTYARMEYRDPASNELVGLDIDLANELAKRLGGLKIVWSETPFAELIPSLQTKRADFIISGISDRASRRESADFVDYLTTGPQFFVMAESEAKAATDLCGKKVGTTRSTSFPVEIEKWSKPNCEAAGKPAIQYVPGENSIDVRNQLKQGRIDAAVQGNETLPYLMDLEPGTYAPVGDAFATQFTGIALPVKEKVLQQAMVDALDSLIADGTYRTLLAKWKLSDNGIEKATINAGQ
ncbi:ABC transporter substrate-binding protein [Bradyrhizobium manausense]